MINTKTSLFPVSAPDQDNTLMRIRDLQYAASSSAALLRPSLVYVRSLRGSSTVASPSVIGSFGHRWHPGLQRTWYASTWPRIDASLEGQGPLFPTSHWTHAMTSLGPVASRGHLCMTPWESLGLFFCTSRSLHGFLSTDPRVTHILPMSRTQTCRGRCFVLWICPTS